MNKTPEHCTEYGARRLAARISRYWAAHGQYVNVKTTEAEFTPAMRSGRFDVRSDMLNGWPRAYALEVLAKRGKRAA